MRECAQDAHYSLGIFVLTGHLENTPPMELPYVGLCRRFDVRMSCFIGTSLQHRRFDPR